MPIANETPTQDRTLEDELHELEENEAALEGRTNSLALTNVLSFLFAFFAFAASIFAILLAVSNNSDDNGMGQRAMGATSGSAPSAMASGGMMGSRAAGATAPAGVRTVRVKLGEMWVRPQYTSVKAGKVTFVASNTGQVVHELMIERMPLKMDGPGRPNEDAAQGMIEDMDPGASGKMALNLKPGSYVLFCNVPGHYAAGQHVRFTVTGS
jgi:uncharacterized cupredoxin-like copper-binding protein